MNRFVLGIDGKVSLGDFTEFLLRNDLAWQDVVSISFVELTLDAGYAVFFDTETVVGSVVGQKLGNAVVGNFRALAPGETYVR